MMPMSDSAPLPAPASPSAPPAITLIGEIRIATAFLTVAPIRLKPPESAANLAAAVRGFPVVGAGIGALGGAVYGLADLAAMPTTVSAILAVASMVVATGGLHEDGLADSVDALGGADPQQRLAIMRDSRIGTFGALALIVTMLLRTSIVAAAGWAGEAALVLIAAGAGSRACLPAIMYLVPPARADGLSYAAGVPDRRHVVDAGALGVIVIFATLGALGTLIAVAAAALAVTAAAAAARRRFGGQTGDVLGAVQQVAEIAILLAFLVIPS